MDRLNVEMLDIKFKNPILTASGTFGFGEEYSQIYDISKLGGICTKGLTIKPKQGNKGTRLWETPMGMMNSIGLQNPGLDNFLNNELPKMKNYNTRIVVNLGGGSIDDYLEGIEKLNNTEIDIVELNISCPNVKSGGMAFGIKSKIAYEVVKEIKQICEKPLMVKLSPNAENIVDMAESCQKAGADAISLINTLKGMAIDIYNKKAVFENTYAGLSGPAIKPIALRMVHEVCKAVEIPVCGIGGIVSGKDVIEYIMAGATLVQVGTGNFTKPDICIDIINEINQFMIEQGISNLSEIRGIV